MAPVLFAAEQTHCSTAQNKAVSSDIIQMRSLLEGQKKTTKQKQPQNKPVS